MKKNSNSLLSGLNAKFFYLPKNTTGIANRIPVLVSMYVKYNVARPRIVVYNILRKIALQEIRSNWMILILSFARSKMYQTTKRRLKLNLVLHNFKTFRSEDLCRTAK